MTDRLDQNVRALVVRVMGMAPEPPPFPQAPLAPRRRLIDRRIGWSGWKIAFASAWILVVVIAIPLLWLSQGPAGPSASTALPIAPPVTTESPPETTIPPSSVRPSPIEMVTFVDPEGFSYVYPSTWFRATASLTPALADPLEMMSLGTYPLRPGGDTCAHIPENALEDLPPTGAFISLQARRTATGSDWPVRPERFGPQVGATESELAFVDCLDESERGDVGLLRWIDFRVGETGIYLLVAIGSEASDQTVDEVWAIANSLSFAAEDPSTPATTAGPAACSTSALDLRLTPQPDLPPAVAVTREAIFEAAVACDFAALQALASAGDQDFTAGFGGGGVSYYADLEAQGSPALADMVRHLNQPYASAPFGEAATIYTWPSAFELLQSPDGTGLPEADYQQLLELYTIEDLREMFDGLGGYVGWRHGILDTGEWLFFVAGD